MTHPMSRSRLRTAVLGASVVAFALSACGGGVTKTSQGASDAGGAVTVQNCGRTVKVNSAPTKAVGLHPAQTELMLRLGLKDKIVGQAQTGAQKLPKDIADQAKGIKQLGDVTPPSREELLAVEPDFVYSPTTFEFSADQGFASIDQLSDAGANVYVASGGCEDRRMTGEVTDLFTDVKNLGTIFGVEDEATKLIEDNEKTLEEVQTATKDVDKLRVAQVYYEGGTLQAIGAGIEYDILKRAGADNVYAPRPARIQELLRRDHFAGIARGGAARGAGVRRLQPGAREGNAGLLEEDVP